MYFEILFFVSHPLFPLLTIIFDKCELATNSSYPIGSLNDDIIRFIQQVLVISNKFF